jgi:hypothetical protein
MLLNKIKENQSEITMFFCVVLISFLSFSFGYIIAKNQTRPSLEFQDIINDQIQENE